MTSRTSSRTVVFARPFVLEGLDGPQAAGAYVVDTNEELLDGLSFPAWHRHSTVIRLHPKPGLTLSATIDPAALDAALALDLAQAAMRLERPLRRANRVDKKMFLDAARSENADRCDAAMPVAGRRNG